MRNAVNLRHGEDLAEFPLSPEATFGVIKQDSVPGAAAIHALPLRWRRAGPAQAPSHVVTLAEAIRHLTK